LYVLYDREINIFEACLACFFESLATQVMCHTTTIF
jgi:hypothetical protein